MVGVDQPPDYHRINPLVRHDKWLSEQLAIDSAGLAQMFRPDLILCAARNLQLSNTASFWTAEQRMTLAWLRRALRGHAGACLGHGTVVQYLPGLTEVPSGRSRRPAK